jgi:hypothetical protein
MIGCKKNLVNFGHKGGPLPKKILNFFYIQIFLLKMLNDLQIS